MRRTASILLPVIATVLLASCAVPLGPGYEIKRQEAQLSYGAGDQRVRVRVAYRLENAGNQPLSALDVVLPAAAVAADAGLRITADGVARAPQPAPAGSRAAEGAALVAVEFDPPWPQKKRLELVLDYALPAPQAAATEAFHFAAEGWFPALVRAEKIFARGRPRHEKVRVAIRLPHGWSLLASGRARGSRRREGLVEHRYELRERDFPPFVLAGRYHAQAVTAHGRTIVFWTKQPLDPAAAAAAGQRLARTVEFYEAAFGPREAKGHRPVWVVEQAIPEEATSRRYPEVLARSRPAPHTALFYSGAGNLVFGSADFLTFVETELLSTWFEHVARPEGHREASLAAVLAYSSQQLAAGAESETARRTEHLAGLIKICDDLESLGAFSSDASEELLRYHKMELFLVALEDRVGREHLQAALKRMVQARRGDTWNVLDLRAALESESGRDLAEMFRQWLTEPGIPPEFRARYGAQEKGK